MNAEKGLENPRAGFFDKLASNWNDTMTTEETKFLRFILSKAITKPDLGRCVLDVGCGTGILFSLLSDWEVTALDISNEMLKRASQKNFKNVVEYIQADACQLPCKSQKFSKVILLAMFPHFEDKIQAMKEIYRVLKPEGVAILVHLKDRTSVNQIHTSIGGAIANDLLPDETMIKSFLLRVGFKIEYSEFNTRIAVICRKPAS